jgi:dipeptidyl aminopeptidase/acylaminoacyl peptidase
MVPVAGGGPVCLIQDGFNNRDPCFRSDGALGFLTDRPQSGVEPEAVSQVWLWEAGRAACLTSEGLGVSSFVFGGMRLVFLAERWPGVAAEKQREYNEDRQKNGPSMLVYRTIRVRHWDQWLPQTLPHLFVQDEDGQRLLTPNPGDKLRESSLCAAGNRAVVVAQALSPDEVTDQWLWAFDLDSGGREEIGRMAGASVSTPVLSEDGRRVLASRHVRQPDRYGARELVVFDIDAGTWAAVPTDLEDLQDPIGLSADGQHAFAIRFQRGLQQVYRLGLADGSAEALTHQGSCDGVLGGDVLVGLWHDFLNPPQPFVLTEQGRQMRPLYPAPALSLEVGSLSAVADDGVEVHAHILKPAGASGPLPVLMLIHGGPIGHWSDGWHWRWNAAFLASQGYLVAMPNPRGSLGYGKAFMEGIWGNSWGAQCYRDLMAFADVLDSRDDVDISRVAAVGGSFGGYMINWFGVMTRRFRCLVSHASISEMGSFQGVTDYPGWWRYQQCVSVFTNPDEQGRYSPMRYLARWSTPVMIIHGDKDYRCPVDQALQLHTGLQLQNVSSELVIFPDEGHWIKKPRNIIAWYGAVLEFLAAQMPDPD